MGITCIRSIGKIQGLSKKEKRLANLPSHPEMSTYFICKVICGSKVASDSEEVGMPPDITGAAWNLQPPQSQELVSEHLSKAEGSTILYH